MTFHDLKRFVLIGMAAGFLGCTTEVEYRRPAVSYETEPVLVSIGPGISVIEDSDQEVFFTGGYYWVHYGGRWWHAPDYHGHWVVVETHAVPEQVLSYPPGRYVHYRHVTVEPERHTVVEEHPVEPVH
jgi:hypothetical protein